MKKIIFLAFTAICILLSGCETNEPQDVYISNDSIYISNDSIYIKNDTVYVENMDLETKVTFYAIDSLIPWVGEMSFFVKKWNKDLEEYRNDEGATFRFSNDKERTFTCYLPRNEKYMLSDSYGKQDFYFNTEGQAQTYRIEFYNYEEYSVSDLFIKSFELESIDY